MQLLVRASLEVFVEVQKFDCSFYSVTISRTGFQRKRLGWVPICQISIMHVNWHMLVMCHLWRKDSCLVIPVFL